MTIRWFTSLFQILRRFRVIIPHKPGQVPTKSKRKDSKVSEPNPRLDEVTATIVDELEEVGLYRYNKLIYIFEYLFIKNFGERYTGEKFTKFPHGPVVAGYKKRLLDLSARGIVALDPDAVKEQRDVDDLQYQLVPIKKTQKTADARVTNPLANRLLLSIIRKYGKLPTEDLERLVYSTGPVKKYLEEVKRGFKRDTGGYVLEGSCIRFKDFDSPVVRGRKLAFKNSLRYPKVNHEQLARFAEELKPLEALRPKYGSI